MEINLEAIIESNDLSVEMTPGLDTLRGISEITRHTAETILLEKNKERLSPKSKIGTLLKKNFNGSYGQKFTLLVDDEAAQKRLRSIGKSTFLEILAYVIAEATYLEPPKVSEKAEKIIDNLGMIVPELVEKIKHSPLKDAHSIVDNFDKKVEIRWPAKTPVKIAEFNETTSENIKSKLNKRIVKLTATIHRFNNITGNGRLKPIDSDETFAFGFQGKFEEIPFLTKKRFSGNLDRNTGVELENALPITIKAQTIRRKDDVILKYIIVSHEN